MKRECQCQCLHDVVLDIHCHHPHHHVNVAVVSVDHHHRRFKEIHWIVCHHVVEALAVEDGAIITIVVVAEVRLVDRRHIDAIHYHPRGVVVSVNRLHLHVIIGGRQIIVIIHQ